MIRNPMLNGEVIRLDAGVRLRARSVGLDNRPGFGMLAMTTADLDSDSSRRVMIEGLSHMTFIVRDLDRMEQILTTVLDARKLYDSGEKGFSLAPERFFDIGGIWVAIMQGQPLPTQTYNHVAFKMGPQDYDDRLRRIRSLGLVVREGRARVEGEGHSIYFHDDDNHLFELHSGTLEERLRRYTQG